MKFQDILGHETVKTRLRDMVDSDRLPHALLLEGPPGVGKFAMARALVQYLHCTDRQGGEPCGRCPSCIQHQSFNHIDTIFSFPVLKSAGGAISDDFIDRWREFLTADPYMNFATWQKMLGNPNGQPVIYVDESQEIIRKLSFTAHSSDYKVVMMWLPEKMHLSCSNKLLKLIEEPLPGVKIILTSDNPKEILPTIYSRLQRVEMKRLPDSDVSYYLTKRYNLDATDAAAIAHNAAGSITLAENHLSKDDESHEFLEFFQSLMRLAYQRKVGMLKKWSQDVAGFGREKSARFCDYCARQVRENFIANLRMPQLNYLNREEQAFSSRFSPFINERNVEDLSALFTQTRGDILANGNAKIIFFDVAVKCILLIKR